jgi:ribonucleoside-triphosphate reductase (thioredoxin)
MDLTQSYQHLSKYARWREQDNRRETYQESVNRSMDFLCDAVDNATGYELTLDEYYDLWESMDGMEAFPSLRLFQMAGPAAERCHVSCYNCSYRAVDSLSAFSEILYILMQGTGAGFSVERQYIDRLPSVLPKKPGIITWKIVDDTEGWCDALALGLRRWTAGLDVKFDYSSIRPAGTRLKTKGGWASGPDSLRDLLVFVRGVVSHYWDTGGRLSPLDCHAIVCKIGEIVVVGGVRRSALLSLFDNDDVAMRRCKSGEFWETSPWLAMANNSAVFTDRPTWKEFNDKLWTPLRDSGTGEPGVWNRGGYSAVRPARRSDTAWGVNPCGEIALRSSGLCNLSRAIARPTDTECSLRHKVVTAAIFGTLQSALTNFGYLPDAWRMNAEEERLLGVTIDGAMDCPLLRPQAPGRERLLCKLRELAVETNRQWAAKLGIPQSAAVTTMQPGGNGPQLFGCSSGLHTRYARHYIRRFRATASDPLSVLLVESGVPWNPEMGRAGTVVFDFPVAAPVDSLVRSDLSALEQFDNWLCFKKNWTEHNPSVTIYVKPEEWDGLGRAVYENWDSVGGLSFLPADGGVYQLAPYEEITEGRYRELVAAMPKVDFSRLPEYEGGTDKTNFVGEVSCVAGACEL